MTALTERLGYGPDAKLLIINCDDLGSTRGANVAIYDALRRGLATSASLMVPAPWARDAAALWRGEDIGVHLTLNSELDTYRWGAITHAPSLSDGDGGYPRTTDDLWDHADLDEVRRECRAQIERAILWGFDVSHLDSHFHAMALRPEFFDIYLELAFDFGLPVRLHDEAHESVVGFPFRKLAADEGIVTPDHFVECSPHPPQSIERALFDLQPGVTEVYVHPCVDTDETRAAYPKWGQRVEDYAFVTDDATLPALIERAGVTLIGYRELRAVQRG